LERFEYLTGLQTQHFQPCFPCSKTAPASPMGFQEICRRYKGLSGNPVNVLVKSQQKWLDFFPFSNPARTRV